jgi:hypothetical protein
VRVPATPIYNELHREIGLPDHEVVCDSILASAVDFYTCTACGAYWREERTNLD